MVLSGSLVLPRPKKNPEGIEPAVGADGFPHPVPRRGRAVDGRQKARKLIRRLGYFCDMGEIARGLMLRHDHGSNYMSCDFQDEIENLRWAASAWWARQDSNLQPSGYSCLSPWAGASDWIAANWPIPAGLVDSGVGRGSAARDSNLRY
jgi:hypothetical protein